MTSSGRLERAYRAFVRCHDVVRAAATEEQLFKDLCEVAVNELGFRLAWIGLVHDGEPRVHPVAEAGYEAGYLESTLITWSDDEHGSGPTGTAIRECCTSVSKDIAHDPRFAPWRADALWRGYASSAAIPLCDGKRCLGALNLYAAEPNAFDDDEIALLEEMAVDLVLALVRLRTERELSTLKLHVDRVARTETACVVATTVAHDVNNLLQVIMMSIESARVKGDGSQQQALDDAGRAAASAAQLLRQLMTLTRRAVDSVDRADGDHVVRGMRSLLSRLAPSAALEFDLGAPGVHAHIAPVELERLLINLVVNAGHAVGSGGPVTVSTSVRHIRDRGLLTPHGPLPPGDYFEFTVADAGAGIAPELLPRIFEPFFSTKGPEGSGLGLPSVLQLARGAGGGVLVDSKPGEGSRFTVLIPVATSRAGERRVDC